MITPPTGKFKNIPTKWAAQSDNEGLDQEGLRGEV